MAKHRFGPGNKFSKGRQPVEPEIKAARKLTRDEFERLVNKYMTASKEEIEAARKDPKLTMLEAMILSIVHKAIVLGDEKRLQFLLDRTIGRIVQPIEIMPPPPEPVLPPPDQGMVIDVTNLTDEQLRDLYAATNAPATIKDVTPQ